jgi:hypothetical protein
MNKTFVMAIMAILATQAFALEIVQPERKVYVDSVPIEIAAGETVSKITYYIDGSEKGSCTNCSVLSGSLASSYGNHTLRATAGDSNMTSWFVLEPFTIEIVKPDREVGNTAVLMAIASEQLDKIEYKIDNGDYRQACTRCMDFEKQITLSDGTHTLTVRGTDEGLTRTDSVTVKANQDEDFKVEIVSPKDEDYGESVLLKFDATAYARMHYVLNGKFYDACNSCDLFTKTLSLDEGEYDLTVYVYKDSDFDTDSVSFTVDEDGDIDLRIISPTDKEYGNDRITLEFRTDKKSDITYELDGKDYTACADCTYFKDYVTLDDGEHTLEVKAERGEDEETEEVEFTIETEQDDEGSLSIKVVQPKSKTYYGKVEVEIEANQDADISYEIDGKRYDSCTDCRRLSDKIELSTGWHTLKATAKADDETETKTVSFKVADEEDKDEDKDEAKPDFGKLPKMLLNGEITDSELAELLRENRFPPGTVNNLIKTGKLGDESIEAILSYQFNPPGIIKHLWGWFGWHQKSYAEEIYDRYNLSEDHQKRILQRDDLPKDKSEKVKEKLEEKVKFGKGNSSKAWKGGHK